MEVAKPGAVLCSKRGAVVWQLVSKLKESAPPPPLRDSIALTYMSHESLLNSFKGEVMINIKPMVSRWLKKASFPMPYTCSHDVGVPSLAKSRGVVARPGGIWRCN